MVKVLKQQTTLFNWGSNKLCEIKMILSTLGDVFSAVFTSLDHTVRRKAVEGICLLSSDCTAQSKQRLLHA